MRAIWRMTARDQCWRAGGWVWVGGAMSVGERSLAEACDRLKRQVAEEQKRIADVLRRPSDGLTLLVLFDRKSSGRQLVESQFVCLR